MKIGAFLKIFAILANVDFNLKKLSPPPPPWFPPSQVAFQTKPAIPIGNTIQTETDFVWVSVLTKYQYFYIILEKGILPY